MADLQIREELRHQRVDQMIYTPIPFPFQPYALQHMVVSDSALGNIRKQKNKNKTE
jgi:hypothetical protein